MSPKLLGLRLGDRRVAIMRPSSYEGVLDQIQAIFPTETEQVERHEIRVIVELNYSEFTGPWEITTTSWRSLIPLVTMVEVVLPDNIATHGTPPREATQRQSDYEEDTKQSFSNQPHALSASFLERHGAYDSPDYEVPISSAMDDIVEADELAVSGQHNEYDADGYIISQQPDRDDDGSNASSHSSEVQEISTYADEDDTTGDMDSLKHHVHIHTSIAVCSPRMSAAHIYVVLPNDPRPLAIPIDDFGCTVQFVKLFIRIQARISLADVWLFYDAGRLRDGQTLESDHLGGGA
ncbi:hypothetical protein PLICRDRAFT_178459 [Plicaturopsis crispa FD-325 SS-3]|nr:hypothetical protein PLICRDRAFT_178459 [Plicaturopsis crispa FD-325 SS-3]